MDQTAICLNENEPKYVSLYNHYKQLILSGTMKAGQRLPSIRECSGVFSLSRTTVESAYALLAAEGYVISKSQSGFYVCSVDFMRAEPDEYEQKGKISDTGVKYDLVSGSGDAESFNFALWRRYVKSALRQTERLLSYGEVQGEYDLREAVCGYINKQRGVVCSAHQIVIAAGTQSLLGILCAITADRKNAAFIGEDFEQGRAVFEDYGKKIVPIDEVRGGLIYTSPSNVNSWGGVLKAQERVKLLAAARKNDCLIVEDDYDSEFRYCSRPIPSLQSLDGGSRVVYIGTFSKLLLPSIRISFMVLTPELEREYRRRAPLYNQTASKAEQIALCQYIRDGRLSAQIRKQRKRYALKTEEVVSTAGEILPKNIELVECQASYLVRIRVKTELTAKELACRAEKNGVRLKPLTERNEKAELLMTLSGFDVNDCRDMLLRLKNSLADS